MRLIVPLSKTKKITLGVATIFFVIFGIPFIATLSSIAWVKITSPPPLLRETADTTPIHVHLGGQDFLIPANYFNNGHPEYAKKDQTAWIHAHWPDMSGSTNESIERRKKYRGRQKRITILIHGSPITIEFWRGRKKFYDRLIGSKHEKFNPPQEKFGLSFHENISEKRSLYADVYVDNREHPLTLITCTGFNRKDIPSPGCIQYFDYRQLRFKISYARDYLPQWKEIQIKIKLLIDRFSQNYPDAHPSSAKGE